MQFPYLARNKEVIKLKHKHRYKRTESLPAIISDGQKYVFLLQLRTWKNSEGSHLHLHYGSQMKHRVRIR
jgi:hypothetical protein